MDPKRLGRARDGAELTLVPDLPPVPAPMGVPWPEDGPTVIQPPVVRWPDEEPTVIKAQEVWWLDEGPTVIKPALAYGDLGAASSEAAAADVRPIKPAAVFYDDDQTVIVDAEILLEQQSERTAGGVDRAVFAQPPKITAVAPPAPQRWLPRLRRRAWLMVAAAAAMAALLWVRDYKASAEANRPAARLKATTHPAPAPPATAVPVKNAERADPARIAADTRAAANHLMAGRTAEALAAYQVLADAHPERPEFAVVVDILERSPDNACARPGDPECARR